MIDICTLYHYELVQKLLELSETCETPAVQNNDKSSSTKVDSAFTEVSNLSDF